MADMQLSVRGLNAWYGLAHALVDFNLDVGPGECVALMGRNGAGKSTTLKALMGLLPKRSGQVQFRGQAVSTWPTHRLARAGLGYVPEDRRIFTELTVEENLRVGAQAPRAGTHTWTLQELYELFPNLQGMAKRSAAHMSGGEQQMLTIARTLMGHPHLVLLDEPSEGVAPLIVEQLAHTINRMKAQGLSVLLCEQNIHFARAVSDRAVVLERGQVCFTGTMGELLDNTDVLREHLAL